MSVATQTSAGPPQRSYQELACHVTRFERPASSFASAANDSVDENNGASPATNWVTNGDPDQDRISNTRKNNRTVGDGYEDLWGSGSPIRPKVNLYNLVHHLRSIGAGTETDQETRENVLSLLKGEKKSFDINTTNVGNPTYNQTRKEVEGTIRAMLQQGMKDQAQALHKEKVEEAVSVATQWLKGTLKDTVETDLHMYNLETYLDTIAGSAKDDDARRTKRKAIQKALLTGHSTVEMSYKDSLRLNEGYRRIKKDEDKEIALSYSDNEPEGKKAMQKTRMKDLASKAKKWYTDSGLSDEDWQISLALRGRAIQNGDTDDTDEGKGGGMDENTATLRSSNLDHFLQRHSAMAKDPEILKTVSEVWHGKGHRSITFKTKEEATALDKAADDSLKEQQALRSKNDQAGLESYSKTKRASWDPYLEEWAKIAGRSFETWENSTSAGNSSKSTTPRPTTSQTRAGRSTSNATKTAQELSKDEVKEIDRFVNSSSGRSGMTDDQLSVMREALRRGGAYGKQGVTEQSERNLASKRGWDGLNTDTRYLDSLNKRIRHPHSGTSAAPVRSSSGLPTIAASA
ncbi:uncharacterized protein I303_104284 [Kwoniella dejecticola CBS 10117]|uniref:Uncharacterized protein n=1 Tax=Kwoniella dejecticola CBS 10117 TaxID=1296121 RepID=A0A1A6A5S4_9TREE|nr:uncharacterized protein I303_04739 [Kwoniella dejecticola CBS 10117]OBR85404.1 hypothetical protein I303_04739 [Kwoniella dejecticola CBS 10117]